jgi:hypothetical protein
MGDDTIDTGDDNIDMGDDSIDMGDNSIDMGYLVILSALPWWRRTNLPSMECQLCTTAMGQGLTLFPISAQLELTPHRSAQLQLTLSPIQPRLTRGCVHEGAQVGL